MAIDNARVAIELLDCWRRLDLEDALSRISDEAVFQADCKSVPVVGRDAIRTAWMEYMRAIKKYEFEVRAVLASERPVFVERNERLWLAGKELLLPITAVFEIDDAGKIAAWRDYWDTSMAK